MKFGIRIPSLKKRLAARTSIKRMIRSKVRMPRGLGFLTNPKKALYNRVYNRTSLKACFIATAVYGDQDDWRVEEFRKFRDTRLSKTIIGRIFISMYYAVSPTVAGWVVRREWARGGCLEFLEWLRSRIR